MAKLGARGRTEVVRVSRELTHADDRIIDWSRKTVAVMSDNSVLSKRDVRFRSDGKKHSYGWKKEGKLKADVTPQAYIEKHFPKEQGWVRE